MDVVCKQSRENYSPLVHFRNTHLWDVPCVKSDLEIRSQDFNPAVIPIKTRRDDRMVAAW